ncbi:MAG TPA: hypothetical protein ENK76_05450 [Campylobacterales bacterium]|nr:hypothetical protein [Campylobacterales bacterium]
MINIVSADIRHFDNELIGLIDDMKDTIKANNAQGLTLFAPLFNASKERLETFYNYDIFATIASLILIVAYLVYAKYQASRVVSCTGCQVVSFTAVAIKYFLITVLLFLGSYYLINPN